MHREGFPVVFKVDVYGVERSDLTVIPGGAVPMLKAVERLGLDPNRYQANIWEVGGLNIFE